MAFVVLTISRKKCDDGTIFLGDGSLAAAPSSRVTNKGIHPVIKVVDDKCL
jgi:kinesin family protein 18/19